MTTESEKSAQSLFEARGVMLCARCGSIMRATGLNAELKSGESLPTCTVCGTPMAVRDIRNDPVGTPSRNALAGFLLPFL